MNYLYNITCHIVRSASPIVEQYLQEEVLPYCRALPSVEEARLLRILSDEIEGVAIALHIELSDLEHLEELAELAATLPTRIAGVPQQALLCFPTLMKVL